jgi:uncharacterized protein
MNPFFFGSRNRQLFGVYHPAKRHPSCMHGVVLCPPIGQEYMRTHMAIRQLAIQLSSVGFDVLKFDYYGLGDSAGTSEEGNPDLWRDDVRTAYRELKDVSGMTSISIIGLRLGAALAAEATFTGLSVKNLLLWDPVVRGREYIEEMRKLTSGVLQGKEDHGPGDCETLVGFPFAARTISMLSAIDLMQIASAGKMNVFLVCSEGREEYGQLHRHIEASGHSVRMINLLEISKGASSEIQGGHIEEAEKMVAQWSDQDEFNQALIAHYAISEITSLLKSAV